VFPFVLFTFFGDYTHNGFQVHVSKASFNKDEVLRLILAEVSYICRAPTQKLF